MKVTEIQSGHLAGTSESQAPSEDEFETESLNIANAISSVLHCWLRPAEDTHCIQNNIM